MAYTNIHDYLRGLWIPLVTPFSEQAVDHNALTRLCRHLRDRDIRGFVVNGTTGEPAAMSDDERQSVLDTVLANRGHARVIAGVSGNNLVHAREQIEALNKMPIDGILVSAPAYIRPDQEGIAQWFEQLADRSRAPLLLYDIPYRSAVEITLSTMQRLAAHPNIVGVKDCAADWGKTQQLIGEGQLHMLAGDDHMLFALACAGGSGAIAAASHVFTKEFALVLKLIDQNKLSEARTLWHRFLPWIRACFTHPNPAAIKLALAHEGHIQAQLRLPLTPCPPAMAHALVQMHQELSTNL